MKSGIILFSLFLSLPAFANPGMEQVDRTERKSLKLDVATEGHPSGVMHQHKDSAQVQSTASATRENTPKPVKKPLSQANKKGRLHK